MSAYSLEAARIERHTSLHHKTGVRILTTYVETSEADGLDNSMPVSGDMLAVIRSARRRTLNRRRRRAAAVISEQEASA